MIGGRIHMKIAVLSDTHGLLRPEVKQMISECDAVLHAGDINSQKIIDEMKAAAKPEAPFYIVRGITIRSGRKNCRIMKNLPWQGKFLHGT